MPRTRSPKSSKVTIKVAQKDGEIKIRPGGNPAVSYPVDDHTVTVGADDPNLGRLQALAAGTTTTPEPPADPQE